MSRFWIFSLAMLLLSGCSSSSAPSEASPSSAIDAIESIDLSRTLSLNDANTFTLLDYAQDTALLLVSDTSRQNPDDLNDQVPTTYYQSFFLLDVPTQTVIEEYPLNQFGICTDAVQAWDGIAFSFFTVDSAENQLVSTIFFADSDAIQPIYSGHFSVFGTGPLLRRFGKDLLVSGLHAREDTFGLLQIDREFEAKPLLSLASDSTDYLSDEVQTSAASYAYAVKESSQVTFYVGSSDKSDTSTASAKITLPQGVELDGFYISGDTLLVSAASSDAEVSPQLLAFDLSTGEKTHTWNLNAPLHEISENAARQICAFSYSTLKEFHLTQTDLQEIPFSSTPVQGEVHRIFPGDEDFLIQTDSALWHLTSGAPS